MRVKLQQNAFRGLKGGSYKQRWNSLQTVDRWT